MNYETLRDVLATKPFQPFRLVMSSGQSYEIQRRDLVLMTKASVVVGDKFADDGIPDEARICSLSQVAAIESSNVKFVG